MGKKVKISGSAHKALADYARKWSGRDDMSLTFAKTDPKVSQFAMTQVETGDIIVDPTTLLLNPANVLNTVTPFRLRQEAVLTGILLHESAHLRYTRWDHPAAKHHDGREPKPATQALARLMEESRIEGRLAVEKRAPGLEWTIRVAVARTSPMTDLPNDPAAQIMAIITSWTIRAARTTAVLRARKEGVPRWVLDFDNLMYGALVDHMTHHAGGGEGEANDVYDLLRDMAGINDPEDAEPDTEPDMLDWAEQVLELLFPGNDDPPQAQTSCGVGSAGSDDGPEGEDAAAGEDEANEGDDEGEGGGGEEEPTEETAALAAALNHAEGKADEEAEENPASGAGVGDVGDQPKGGWRSPTPDERQMQKGAEHFLRGLIDPSETTVQTLTESPSATVDAAALASWKAGGQQRDPMFFVRRRREVQPQPPVKVAVLVDISMSMNVMQKPSALLSWALAEAAIDMRNFAGRGQQIESCLIHWGSRVHVVQRPGELLPGIKERPCNEFTDAMGEALLKVDELMPGFFDPSPEGRPENRLLVQFTDWELGQGHRTVSRILHEGIGAGMSMLSIMPTRASGDLPRVMHGAPAGPGRSMRMTYDASHPSRVWDATSALLRG